jgi:hypothetical protein
VKTSQVSDAHVQAAPLEVDDMQCALADQPVAGRVVVMARDLRRSRDVGQGGDFRARPVQFAPSQQGRCGGLKAVELVNLHCGKAWPRHGRLCIVQSAQDPPGFALNIPLS